jgi:hypothetical protein
VVCLTVSVVSVGGAGCNSVRRLEKEDASAQGVLVISTHPCGSLGPKATLRQLGIEPGK